MSWLSKLLPPKINFEDGSTVKANVPEGLWCKCDSCGEILYCTDLSASLQVCAKCSFHHIMSAKERIEMLLEVDNRQKIAPNLQSVDILIFKDSKKYSDRLIQAQEKLKINDALLSVKGLIYDLEVVISAFEFRFIGGSMGSVVGEGFVQAVKVAIENNCPFICVATSGGARMQEGLNSLMQMAKTVAILTKLSAQNLPFISVLTDPTMGGVSASFAFLGDVVIAEPNALIGFAGPRVIEQTVKEKLPDKFQRAELLLENGALDMVVSRLKLKAEIYKICKLLMANNLKIK